MDANQKAETEKLRNELKTALDNNDIETLRRRIDELEKAAAYMQQQQGNPYGGNPNPNPQGEQQSSNAQQGKDDDVIDADFTDSK